MATISNDPRFQLARALLSSQGSGSVGDHGDGNSSGEGGGPEAAIDVFATLLELSHKRDGETSLNAALCQYEYGNAIFRAVVRKKDLLEDADDGKNTQGKEDEKLAPVKGSQREIMASAAMKRSAAGAGQSASGGKRAKISNHCFDNKAMLKQGDGIHCKNNAGLSSANEGVAEMNNTAGSDDGNSDEDDVALALEMMETSFAILLSHATSEDGSKKEQKQWALGQLPRVLVCIGDLHSFRGRWGNAVDAYCRALPYREEAWKRLKQRHPDNSGETEILTLEGLQCQRHLVETYALVTEALLACPEGEDVICYYDDDDHGEAKGSATTAKGSKEGEGSEDEMGTALVPASERLNFAESHYELAREGLEELLARMGKMVAAKIEIGNEKKDIGYLVMMMVGVGNSIKGEN